MLSTRILRTALLSFLAVAATLLISACLGKALAAEIPETAQRYRAELMRASHLQWGLDAPIPAFAGQVQQESGWNPAAVSRVGARGMAQFMPATATWWCQRTGTAAADCQPANPAWALRALVGYDRYLFDRVQGRSEFDRLWAALRAYNGGLGHWEAEAKAARSDRREDIDAACGAARRNVRHCPENLSYPQRILIRNQPRYASWGREVKP